MNYIDNACMYKFLQDSSRFFRFLWDPTCAMFSKCVGFNDIKHDICIHLAHILRTPCTRLAHIFRTPCTHLVHILHTSCKYTNTKCLKDQTCAIFFKSIGFKDIEYDIPVHQMLNTQIRKYIYTLHLHITLTHGY